MIRQGEVYWIDLGEPRGSAPGYRRPHVILQNDVFNRSRIRTAVVCALSTNLRLAEAPGNILLDEGEAGLSKRSVAIVSQVFTVDKEDLVERIGAIRPRRLLEILAGLRLVTEPREAD